MAMPNANRTPSVHGPIRIHPGETAVVVGAGLSGLAAAALLDHLSGSVRLVDSGKVSLEVRDQAEKHDWDLREGGHNAEQFHGADLVVLSPGVNRRKLEPWLSGLQPERVIAELELALGFVDEPITAVTGTSGKTTTTTLIGRFLEAMGRRVFVGGNIGTPLSRYALERLLAAERRSPPEFQKADNLVLEVSSFQLLNTRSLCPEIGVLLNVSPNHLDYHQDMDEYLQAKLSLFASQEPEDLAIFPEEMRELVRDRRVTQARTVFFGTQTDVTCPALPGRHNQANIAAAFQACLPFGLTRVAAQKALDGFSGLPHRLQIVAERSGVLFVDDSKGTTIQALRAALEAFDRPVLLLAGGVFKGGDLADLRSLVHRKARAVGLFGASREIFEAAWADAGTSLFWEPTLEQAMTRLWLHACPGDVMLLSPATASFDLFQDYRHRGMTFQRHIQALAEVGHG